jgi:prepilin-type N-terminal cleavage/methylation domain-containing protein
MKKALTLIEVLVAIMLISVVITAMLNIKSNNLYMLDKFKESTLYNSYISLAVDTNNLKDQNIYLDNIIKIDDDQIRKELKSIKVVVKNLDDDEIKLPPNDYVQLATIKKTKFSIDDRSKIFYKFKLEYK